MFERAGVPKHLRPLVGGKVNVDLIDRNWADILLAAIIIYWNQPDRRIPLARHGPTGNAKRLA